MSTQGCYLFWRVFVLKTSQKQKLPVIRRTPLTRLCNCTELEEKETKLRNFFMYILVNNRLRYDIINIRNRRRESLRLIKKRQKITKPSKLRFDLDSNLNRKVWVPRQPDKRGTVEVAAIDLELLFRNNEKNRWSGGYLEFNEQRVSTSTERNRQEFTENVSSTEGSEVARPTASFPIVDLKDHEIAEKKTFHYIQVNYMIEKPKIVNAEAEENLRKSEFNFMVDLKTLIHKISVDPQLLRLKICLRNDHKERAPEEISPVFIEFTKRFGLLFAGDKIVRPEELKKQVVDTLHFGHPELTKMLAESNIFC